MRPMFLASVAVFLMGSMSVGQQPAVSTPDLVNALIVSLHDVDLEVRNYAAGALAAVGAEAIDALVKTLKDPLPEARSAAAYALGQMGVPAMAASAALVQSLRDEVTEVRRQSAQALARIIQAEKLPTGSFFQPLPKSPAPLPPPPPPAIPQAEKPAKP